jgi:hypothetical protein
MQLLGVAHFLVLRYSNREVDWNAVA